jgi:hypothetical protein
MDVASSMNGRNERCVQGSDQKTLREGIWNNIEIDRKDVGDNDVNYIYLVWYKDQWLTLVYIEPSSSTQVR